MFEYIKNLFKRKQDIKNFSTTLTTANEGSDSKKKLSPEIENIIKNLKDKKTISNNDMGVLAEFYFGVTPIEPGLYRIRNSIIEGMCFDIVDVNLTYNDVGDVDKLRLSLKEVTLNNNIVITIDVENFSELFEQINFDFNKEKEL